MSEQKTAITYKGYEIKAMPNRLRESGQWRVSICILKHNGYNVVTRSFSCSNIYTTKEETVKHCFNFGRQIIDNNMKIVPRR